MRQDVYERFWSKVDKTNTCWLWTASLNGTGYAQFWVIGRNAAIVAHRWLYEQIYGELSHGLQLHHICKTRRCVNPSHLVAVTPLENSSFIVRTDRKSTHCSSGHPRTPENTNWIPHCKVCNRARMHRIRSLQPK